MVTAIKQMGTVGKDGKIELYTPELLEGTQVKIILLVNSEDETSEDETSEDETDYLLSNSVNRKRLLDAVSNLEKGKGLVTISAEEWREKYCI